MLIIRVVNIEGLVQYMDRGEIIGVEYSSETLNGISRLNLIAKMRIRSGVSGGAVVDANGNVIGVAHSTQKNDDGTYRTTISPIDKILEEM